MNQVETFNRKNPSIAVNVYYANDKSKIYPLVIAKNQDPGKITHEINLFKA